MNDDPEAVRHAACVTVCPSVGKWVCPASLPNAHMVYHTTSILVKLSADIHGSTVLAPLHPQPFDCTLLIWDAAQEAPSSLQAY